MIKVCHFVNLITGKSDGVFNHLCMIFSTYDRIQYQHILVFQGGDIIEEKLKNLNITFYKVESLKKKYSIKSFNHIYKIIKKENPDILHVHLLKPYTIVGLLNIILRKKLIYNYHGLFIKNIYNSRFQKIVYLFAHKVITLFKAVDLVIVPSKNSKELLLKETKLFKEILPYYNSASYLGNNLISDILVNELLSIKKDCFLIGIIARLSVEKRIDRALEILKLLRQKNHAVFFAFFGDGLLEQDMKSLAIKLGLEKNCKFFGFIENAAAYMRHFDLILFTSDWEGLPLTIWESMSNAVPVISTNVGGIKEIIESEKCGVMFDKENLSEAVNIISDLIANSEKLKLMGQKGKEAINKKYSINNFSDGIDKFYKRVYEN